MAIALALIGALTQLIAAIPGFIISIRTILRERREKIQQAIIDAGGGQPVPVDPEVTKRLLAHRAPLSLFCAIIAELITLALIIFGPGRGQGPVPLIDVVVVVLVGGLVLVSGGSGVDKAWTTRKDGWQAWLYPVIGVGVAGVAWFSALIVTAPLW